MSSKDHTIEFLRAIAARLSSRSSCRRVEYIVYIGSPPDIEGHQLRLSETDVSDKVFFYPERDVYPDLHHRRRSDLRDIVYHVMKTQFADTVYSHNDVYGLACFRPGSLTPGVYQYVLSFDKKRRQWVRKR